MQVFSMTNCLHSCMLDRGQGVWSPGSACTHVHLQVIVRLSVHAGGVATIITCSRVRPGRCKGSDCEFRYTH